MGKKAKEKKTSRETSKKSKVKESRFKLLLRSKWMKESVGIFCLAVAIFFAISLLTHRQIEQQLLNRCGIIGQVGANFLWDFFGYVSLLFPVILGLIGLITFRHRRIERQAARLLGLVLFIPFSSALLSLLFHPGTWRGILINPGGNVGDFIANQGRNYFGLWGSRILTLALVLVAFLIVTDISYYLLSQKARSKLIDLFFKIMSVIRNSFSNWYEKRKANRVLQKEIKIKAYQDKQIKSAAKSKRLRESNSLVEERDEDFKITPPPIIVNSVPHEQPSQEDENEKIPDFSVNSSEFTSKFIQTTMDYYEVPSLNLLDNPQPQIVTESTDELLKKSEILINKLNDFNISGRITEVCPGPVITRFEFEPPPGIKISRIIGLADDLALGLKSKFGLRISPVPGKSTLGLEVPNNNRETVYLKELLCTEEFKTASKKSPLTLPFGKTISGQPYYTDLKRMPHLLIAGATGSGKSVCINSILCGLLYSATPYQLRLILIDPKMLELSDFNGIPHLRNEVITDVKLAPVALNWAVEEMSNRYTLLAAAGVRNIDQYNAKVSKPDHEGDEVPLPYIVIVIDELADLMLTAGNDVEEAIQRLAQMARAAGIHLIIATQRPSVDVITGVIKANLPCRLAFQVASKVDSRTILDAGGAEKLLGMGDCLFIPPGTSQMIRLHGAYVSESETKRVVNFLQQQKIAEHVEEESIFKTMESTKMQIDDAEDPLYNQAVKIVLSSNLASISMLQRRLKVGHSRASRLIDIMELNEIVGPYEGSKPREILVDADEFLERINQIEEDGVYDN